MSGTIFNVDLKILCIIFVAVNFIDIIQLYKNTSENDIHAEKYF